MKYHRGYVRCNGKKSVEKFKGNVVMQKMGARYLKLVACGQIAACQLQGNNGNQQ